MVSSDTRITRYGGKSLNVVGSMWQGKCARVARMGVPIPIDVGPRALSPRSAAANSMTRGLVTTAHGGRGRRHGPTTIHGTACRWRLVLTDLTQRPIDSMIQLPGDGRSIPRPGAPGGASFPPIRPRGPVRLCRPIPSEPIAAPRFSRLATPLPLHPLHLRASDRPVAASPTCPRARRRRRHVYVARGRSAAGHGREGRGGGRTARQVPRRTGIHP